MEIARYYTLHLVLTLLLLMLSAAGVAVGLCYQAMSFGTLLVVVSAFVLLLTLCRLVHLVRFPINHATFFTRALTNRDATLRCRTTRDLLLGEMMDDMNSVLAAYCHDRTEMEQSRKYNNDILRVMTHELRNTITPIVSLTSWLQSAEQRPEETAEAIGVIHNQAVEIQSFLDSYQKLTHLPAPELADVSVGELFRSLATLFADPTDSQRITFSADKDITVRADAGLLSLALNNLIRNALRATSGQDDGHVSVTAFDDTDCLRIVVGNNGPSLTDAEIERIFQPFYTTDRHHGSGIGLPLTRRIAEAHGGTLTCESLPALTFFELSLPRL